ncbi:hypothetical protein NA57DRAFT_72286 [Rhizodiscina lignyota]|uniref:Uncharacterized protein n=1 Tax=Rhizodiscina lignyota TaxID=1504668 RepID=A0A9P4IKN5_9PEZI|nr:hypothetical protein NA57DRAFT_72286 [Rhizodiscina lignyota]
MAPKASSTPKTLAAHPPSVEEGLIPAIRRLISSVKAVSSLNDFELIADQFDSTERLQGELEEKETQLDVHLKSVGKLVNEKASLELSLEERDETVNKAEKKADSLQKRVQQLEEAIHKQNDILTKFKAKTIDQEKELKAREEQVKQLGRKLREEQDRATQFEEGLKLLNTQHAATAEKHETTERRLAEIETYMRRLRHEEPKVLDRVNRMNALWANTFNLVATYFKENLPNDCLKKASAWELLQDPDIFNHRVPLPRTNSAPAKQMRIAVILAIIARLLDKHIFYLTHELEEHSGIRTTLLQIAVDHSAKESFVRSVLLSLSPEDEEATTERINTFREQVMAYVEELLGTSAAATFNSELEKIARSAYETWDAVRTTTERYEPTFDADIEQFEWNTLDLDAAVPNENTRRAAISGGRDDELLIVLPQFYVVKNNKPPQLIADGTVLRRSQSLAAAQEENRQKSNPAFAKTASKGQSARRMSRVNTLPISPELNGNQDVEPFLGQEHGGNN